jgi:hypothetical protein
MKPIHVGDGACWVEENGSRRREREWGKKKERRDEEERGRVTPDFNAKPNAPSMCAQESSLHTYRTENGYIITNVSNI